MRAFERFAAWRACQRFAVAVHAVTRGCPPSAAQGLPERARRAAFRAAIALAAGSGRRDRRAVRSALDASLGALAECAGLLAQARDRGLIDASAFRHLDARRDEAGKLVWRLYHHLGRGEIVH